MTRLMGILLGVSFQTELLIMTLLGLANSTLDWKPFELNSRLTLIKELNFSDDNVQFSSAFSERIRNLLKVTVVVEFFCGLLNPLTHLLKLYPIITWSRSNFLLPWLLTHALNTILPKVLSVSLVFVFYKANKISTLSLLEFLVVESINLSIASYNWYVFFAFYLNLREVEKNRLHRVMSEEKMIVGPNSLSQSYSIPDLQEMFRDSELEPNRSARSLTFMIENESQYLEDDSATLSFEESLTPVEKSMKILKLTPMDLEIAKREKYQPIVSKQIIDQSDSSVETHKAACSCSSSSDDEDDNNEAMAFFISKKAPIKKHPPDGLATVSLEIHSLPRINSSDQSTQIAQTFLNDPFVNSFSLQNHSNDNRNSQRTNDDLYLLLSKNIELLDKMCLAISSKIKNVPNDSMQKWLIFQRELECNLHRYASNKESSVVDTSVKCLSSFVSENSTDKGLIDKSKDSKFTSFSAFNRMLSRNVTTYAYRAQVSSSRNAMRSRRTIGSITNKWTKDNSEETKIQELWNLKRYNDFTLEQDRREMCEKNKKSKLTSYKNVTELKKPIEKNEVVRKEEKRPNEMRKQRSRVKSVRSKKLTSQEKDKTRRPRLFSAKNLPKKLSYLSQANRFNVKDQIKKINWRIDLRCHERRSPCKLTKSRYRKNLVPSADHQRIDRLEDETLSELQNAFSHSDESERGFQLGPETNQPYPIFQMVARTLNEILKSNGWRELFQATSSSLDHLDATSEQHFPMNDEVIICGNENISTTTIDDSINNDSRVHNEWEEIERRKAESVSLVRQLEQLLDTSRETLSAIESSSSVPAIDDTSPEVLLKRYFDRLQSDEIAQTIANWATESVDSFDSLDFPRSTLKLAARTELSFSDNSEMEEFPANN